MLEKLKYFVFPKNPVDERPWSRMKRGAIHYAHTGGISAIPPMQRWLRRRSYTFRHGMNGSSTQIKLSGADLTHLWVADEVFAGDVYRLELVPFVPEFVLDLGANIGLFTLLASLRWPGSQFVCVEPHPDTFSYLCANLSLNGISAIKLQCAVEERTRMMFLCNEGAVYQTLCEAPTGVPAMTVPLDALLPDTMRLVIKMDIEGAEKNALEALTRKLPEHTFVFIELHEGDESLEWVHGWATRNGFDFSLLRRRETAIDGFLSRPRAPKA